MLVLPAELTHANAHACLVSLMDQSRAHTGVIRVDASQLVQFDSSCISVLLELGRFVQTWRCSLQVVAMPKRLITLATAYGVCDLLTTSVA